jgi:cytochrome c oxidase subunit 4
MAETKHDGHENQGDHGALFRVYMIVAIALSVFTAASFLVNLLERGVGLDLFVGFLMILTVAVCKAGLVGAYFMHLKWDWSKLFFLIIPAFILGTMMMIVLLPDIVLAWGPP